MAQLIKYFLTVSPRYRNEDPLRLFDRDRYDLRKILNHFSNHYILYPEYDKSQRLHYHGIIYVTNRMRMIKDKHRIDLIGFCKFDQIDNFTQHLRSLTYSMKEWAQTKELHKEPIIYKSFKRTPKVPLPQLDAVSIWINRITEETRSGLIAEYKAKKLSLACAVAECLIFIKSDSVYKNEYSRCALAGLPGT